MPYVHQLSSVAFELGGTALHWYWLFYLLGFVFVFYGGQKLIQWGYGSISREEFAKVALVCWVAMFVGGRIFYVLVYHWSYFKQHPFMIIKIWTGGMSFHGGLLGVVLAAFVMTRIFKIPFFAFTDLVATLVPGGLMLGRVGNFINGELVGRPSDVPWAVVFPRLSDSLPRHPSQLYGAMVEGLLLFILLYSQKKYLFIRAYQSTLFLMGYGIGRFVVGFFRAPDSQLGYFWSSFSIGQLLCLIMVGVAFFLEWKYQAMRFRLKNNSNEL